jgi:Icc-related predicted phosphoesterase
MDRQVLLICTDVHKNVDNVKRMQEDIKSRGVVPDVVICCGDIADLATEHFGEDGLEESAKIDMEHVLAALAKIGTVIFVPGNHDPSSSYLDSPTTIPNTINLHRQAHAAYPNLMIWGFGGSVPAFKNNALFWEGKPFDTEEAFASSFQPWERDLRSAAETATSTADYVLLTHVGPEGTDTVAYPGESEADAPIYMGSSTLRSHLQSSFAKEHCLLHLHGHTHPAPGISNVNGIPVCNVGSLNEGRYGLVELRFGADSQRLSLASVQLCRLPEP